MERSCAYCGNSLKFKRADAVFCQPKCRVYDSRRKKHGPLEQYPVDMTSRQNWIRRSHSKVPLTVDGRASSATDSSLWSDYETAAQSSVGAGLGFVLDGSGIGCIDLDDAIIDGQVQDWAQEILDANPNTFTEVSQSGNGIHVWGLLDGSRGRVVRDGRNIEVYSDGRYMALGQRVADSPLALDWLVVPE